MTRKRKIDIYNEVDNFVEENGGEVTHTEIARHFFELGRNNAIDKPHWISVEDKLPMEYEPVLAAFGNHYARVCFYCGGKWYIDAGVVSDEVFGVSHWIQIPPPPKKGD